MKYAIKTTIHPSLSAILPVIMAGGLLPLPSTHPPKEERIARLETTAPRTY